MIGELQLETELRNVIEQKRLRVFYQPIVEIETGTVCGFEALARWPEDAEREVPSTDFIAVAESTGLIRPLGRLVLLEACSQMEAWRAAGLLDDELTISVNISAGQLGAPDLLDDVGLALNKSGLPGDRLLLEVTEHAIMRDPHLMPAVLSQLGQLGVRAQIDDFGTGYSSLDFLRHFAGNTLKIDQSFIASLGDAGSAEIVRAIVDLAGNLNLGVIAEGVETEEQRQALRRLGVPYAQGFLFSRPLSAGGVEALLARTRHAPAAALRPE
jgi:EAL domain-containing protein (putative c-di-GMP-specific phosphodiesterase class I)